MVLGKYRHTREAAGYMQSPPATDLFHFLPLHETALKSRAVGTRKSKGEMVP